MDTELRQTILEANLDLHRDEAGLYDRIHPELNNEEEWSRLDRMLGVALNGLPSDAPKLALDVGAGTGFVTGRLLKLGFKVQAVDISNEMLGMLSSKFAADVQAGKVSTMAQDIDSFLGECADGYSIITISSVLHHLPDYVATLGRLAQRLIPGGALVIFHEPTGGELSWMEKILLSLDWKFSWRFQTSSHDREFIKSKRLDYGMADYHVTHGFDEERVREALKAEGLKIDVVEMYATAKTKPIRLLLRVLGMKRTWCLSARK
ncbi:class I SAM-dependent methyltransferase [Candidatus Uhrbacteria bacterium]|nr:class I SAM-dependent methyltransferase [Candidatus Uhrbacteria bacterium]